MKSQDSAPEAQKPCDLNRLCAKNELRLNGLEIVHGRLLSEFEDT